MAEAKGKFNKDMIIGDVIGAHPDAARIIEKHFGGGCFTCPGIRMESISFGAMMHGTDPDIIIEELNALE